MRRRDLRARCCFDRSRPALSHPALGRIVHAALAAPAASAYLAWQLVRAEPPPAAYQAYHAYRANLGRAILLGLEFLVAADIVGTVAFDALQLGHPGRHRPDPDLPQLLARGRDRGPLALAARAEEKRRLTMPPTGHARLREAASHTWTWVGSGEDEEDRKRLSQAGGVG